MAGSSQILLFVKLYFFGRGIAKCYADGKYSTLGKLHAESDNL